MQGPVSGQISQLHEKAGFPRSQKNEEARVLNQQFQANTSKVYANMRELLNKDKEDERPRYTTSDQNTQEEREMFNNVEEASEYWTESKVNIDGE